VQECGLCYRTVCPSRSCILLKRVNISWKFVHHRVATPFWFFHTKRYDSIPTGTPNWSKKSQFLTNIWLWHRSLLDRHVLSVFRRWTIGYSSMRHLSPTINKRRGATHQWISFMTEILDHVTPKTTEQKLTVRTVKCVAEVTSNKRLHSNYCKVLKLTIEYKQTGSITPLCDCRDSRFRHILSSRYATDSKPI